MKPRIVIFIILVNIINSYSQSYNLDTIIYGYSCKCSNLKDIDTSTCIDEFGKKQGYWKYYKEFIYTVKTNTGLAGRYNKDYTYIGTVKILIKQGFYCDDVLCGKWDFYNSCYQHNGEGFTYIDSSITYFPDGSIEVERGFFGNYRIKYNRDSSVVVGSFTRHIGYYTLSEIPHPVPKSYYITMDSKKVDGSIILRFMYNDFVLKEFELFEFDDEYDRLSEGLYDDQIMKLTP